MVGTTNIMTDELPFVSMQHYGIYMKTTICLFPEK